MNDEISKEEFAKQKEKMESILLNLKNQIFEFEKSFKEVIDKKNRLLSIKDFLYEKLKSAEGIDNEIINHFLKEVIIKEDGGVAIILDGDFNFMFDKIETGYILSK